MPAGGLLRCEISRLRVCYNQGKKQAGYLAERKIKMATDREMKANKEEKLFDLLMARRLLKKGKIKEAEDYLETAEERTHSGMTVEEIETVSARVDRAIKV
jgi:hypothetical protein